MGGERRELKHLSTRPGKEINRDSPSSGERTGNSPNRMSVKVSVRELIGVVGQSEET